jgi:hypothetical protein
VGVDHYNRAIGSHSYPWTFGRRDDRLATAVPYAHAEVVVRIDKSSQRMLVSVGASVGSYPPERLESS